MPTTGAGTQSRALRRLHVSRLVPAPTSLVWDLLVTVEQWPRWGPSVRAVALDTPRIVGGSRGTVYSVLGLALHFEVTAFEEGRAWSWSVAGLPATDHAVVGIDGETRVTFGVPWLAAPYLGVCALALRRIERLVAVGT